MLTLGIDLASEPKNTGVCLLRWRKGHVELVDVEESADDDQLRRLIRKAHVVGIDVPLGWPRSFVDAIAHWSQGEKWPYVSHAAPKRRLRLRLTDRLLPCKDPLSVSADRIAVPAFRAAALLSSLDLHVPRDGTGKIIEVYPYASLDRWLGGKRFQGYKQPDATALRRSVIQRLVRRLGSIPANFEVYRRRCLGCDDHVDAFVASLTARAAKCGYTQRPTARQELIARAEGWIHVPASDSLTKLLAPAAHIGEISRVKKQ